MTTKAELVERAIAEHGGAPLREFQRIIVSVSVAAERDRAAIRRVALEAFEEDAERFAAHGSSAAFMTMVTAAIVHQHAQSIRKEG
jgi:hypothetical protein